MATPGRTTELKMDAENLYREETFTDRRVGTIRRMSPVKADGSVDDKRKTLYIGEAQLLTPVGALPIAFEIEAVSLDQAVANYAAAAKAGMERAMKELQEMRREAASSIVIPERGMPGVGGPGGKIQMP